MPDKQTANQMVREIYETHIGLWQTYRDAMDKEESFHDGHRYEKDEGEYNRDRRRTQIRGQEIQDTVRHVAAKATERPMALEARPIDSDDDPELAELAVSLIEHELTNPWKGYQDREEEAIMSAREKRLGVVWMDWDPDEGPFGELLYSFIDPRRIMWDPSYDPHHPKCAWVHIEKRVPVSWIHKTFKGSDWVGPDRSAVSGETARLGVPILQGANGARLTSDILSRDDKKATLWFLWLKKDETIKEKPREGGFEPFKNEDDRFLVCVANCGFRSETQGALKEKKSDIDMLGMEREEGDLELPELLEQGCPHCAGNLERIDGHIVDEFVREFERGKRLIIMAPFSPAPDDKPLYDGKWPISKARSYPGLFITSYIKPGRPMGPSDTALMWDQQVAADNLRTLALQRVFEHRNYWVLPRTGIYDSQGGRFKFREDQFNVMYRDGTSQGPLNIELLNGTGLDPGWQVAFGTVHDALTRYRPALDVGPAEERSRNIPVGTIERITREVEVSTEHFNRRKNRERSKFAGVVWDYIRATYTPQRLSRLNIDGSDILMRLSGDDLPNFDFVIEDAPQFTGIERARAEAFQALMQMAINPQTQPFLDIFAEVNNLPRSIVRKIERRVKEIQAQAPPPVGLEGMEGGLPDMGAALGAPGGEAGVPMGGAGEVPATF